MIRQKDISVIIQGPIDNRTYESIDSYYSQGFRDIIISTWENEDISLIKSKTSIPFSLVASKYPKNMSKINNEGSRFYIAYTTLKGSLLAKNHFVLKTRSDEIYPDLSKFISNFNKHKNRIHTTNNGFWKRYPACFSNHIFLAKKEIIIECCEKIIKHCSYEYKENINIFCSEQEFGFFLMEAIGFDLLKEDWKKVFRENVFITPCSDLPYHLHSGQSSTRYKFRRSSNYPYGRPDNHNINDLYNNIEEIL